MIVRTVLTFSSIEDPNFKKIVRLENLLFSSFMTYMKLLTEQVEKKISLKLLSIVALVLDGWSCDSMHYLVIFASF